MKMAVVPRRSINGWKSHRLCQKVASDCQTSIKYLIALGKVYIVLELYILLSVGRRNCGLLHIYVIVIFSYPMVSIVDKKICKRIIKVWTVCSMNISIQIYFHRVEILHPL